MSVLVLGAGGFLGLNVVDALLASGIVPRCGRRRRGNVLGLRQREVPLVEADLDQGATLAAAMAGCRTVVHLAGHYPRLSNRPLEAVQLATRQTKEVLQAAVAARVERLIYVSSTATVAVVAGRASNEDDVFSSSPGFGTYHAVKWAMEAAVASERFVQTVTVCPGACLGAFDWKIGTAAMLWSLRRGECPPHPEGLVSWVDVRDVALAIARLVAAPAAPKRVLLSAGSVPFHPFLLQIAERYGVRHVSEPLRPQVAIALADAEEAKALAEGGRPRLSREIVDLILHGPCIDAALSRELLGLTYRPLEQTLAAFDAWATQMGAPIPNSAEERM